MGFVRQEATPKSQKVILPPLKENIEVNSELESRVENAVIAMLEEKCKELGREVEEARAQKKEFEIDNTRLRGVIGKLEIVNKNSPIRLLQHLFPFFLDTFSNFFNRSSEI